MNWPLKALGIHERPAPPDYVADVIHAGLERLANHSEPMREERSASYGHGYESLAPDLIVRPYDWGYEGEDADLPANLEFGGVKIWWYKYLGRGMETDRERTHQEWGEWMSSFLSWVEDTVAKEQDGY